MSTPKWSDDELDEFFRQSAEEADPPYDPAAWQDLKNRLNTHDRGLWLNTVSRWVLPVLVLLISTGGLIWYTRFPRVSPLKSLTGKSVNAPTTGKTPGTSPIGLGIPRPVSDPASRLVNRKTVPAGTGDPISNRVSSVRKKDSVRYSAPAGEDVGRTGNRSKTTQLVVTNQPAANRLTTQPLEDAPRSGDLSQSGWPTRPLTTESSRAERQQQPQLATNRTQQLADRRSGPPTGIARQDAKTGGLGRHRSRVSGLLNTDDAGEDFFSGTSSVPPSATTVSEREALLPAGRFVWSTPAPLLIKPAVWPFPPVTTPEPIWQPDALPMQRSTPVRLSGLSMQVVLSPDLSTIGLHNFDRPGSNIGLVAQYRLAKRFSIQAGALWSTKRYTSSASEYVWPAYGSASVRPESILGKCTMLDLPLNLRYDVLLRPGKTGGMQTHRWFVSGGVTSYVIDHEAYTYNYANPDDPGITRRGWDNKLAGRKGGSFGLSNVNISLGYERSVSQRLSWQIEPFMKIPLQPIGYLKVRLLSTGAFLSLRYRL